MYLFDLFFKARLSRKTTESKSKGKRELFGFS